MNTSQYVFFMFLAEGERLKNEGKLLESIVALKNACASKQITAQGAKELDDIIRSMSSEFRFGYTKKHAKRT